MEIGGKRREGYIKLQMEMTNDKKKQIYSQDTWDVAQGL